MVPNLKIKNLKHREGSLQFSQDVQAVISPPKKYISKGYTQRENGPGKTAVFSPVDVDEWVEIFFEGALLFQ